MNGFTKPVAEWPTLLCGPVLRRVTYQSVSVFVATRFARQVSLTLSQRSDVGQPLPASVGPSAPVPTIRLGRRLHVALVTLQGLSLLPGTAYCYDLTFHKVAAATGDDPDTDADITSLATIDGGMLLANAASGRLPLGYAPNLLPSFLTPPLAAAQLNFFHGSCRKMHGGGLDALPLLDDQLKDCHLKPAPARPQMLFLTGDQIYADDVAGPLLPVLSELAGLLLGWDEKVPTPSGWKTLADLQPGSRSRLILRYDMTSGEGHCHLLGLGEFYAMYLLAWSPALWPDAWPAIEVVMPKEVFMRRLPEGLNPEKRKHLEAIREYRDKHANWDRTVDALKTFKNTLGQVQRLLANIPSYMMFDDHEVTDDWYLHSDWQVDVLLKPLGQRVIGNALSAYAVFQGWGNDPTGPTGAFAVGAPGQELLSRLAAAGLLTGDTYQQGQDAHDAIRQLLRVTAQSGGQGVLWDYAIDVGGDWHAIVLDTRTHRNLTRKGQVDLIDIPDLQRQLAARSSAAGAKTLAIIVSPAPVVGHPVIEKILAEVVRLFPSLRSTLDNETWANPVAPAAFEELLAQMSACGRVVILSGDVHYGFSALVSYWNERSQPHRAASFVQLCSSALKNEDFKTRTVGSVGTAAFEECLGSADNPLGKLLLSAADVLGQHAADQLRKAVIALSKSFVPPPRIDVIGWHLKPAFPPHSSSSPLQAPKAVPAILEIPRDPVVIDLPPPDWRYRIQFVADLALDDSQPEVPGVETDLQRKQRLAREALTCHRSMQHRVVIGENNIGRVQMRGTAVALRVLHDLHRPGSGGVAHTRHLIPFDPPDDSVVRPGLEIGTPLFAPDLSLWMELASFHPPPSVEGLHQLELAWGPLRVDVYGVHVTRPPTSLPGDPAGTSRVVSLQDLMRCMRQQMLVPGALFAPPHAGFSCPDAAQAARWGGSHDGAEGITLLTAQQQWPGTPDSRIAYRSVLVTPASWILSSCAGPDPDTVFSKRGFYGAAVPSAPHWFIFTLGAHREARRVSVGESAWRENHRRWESFAQQLVTWIGAHGGTAQLIGSALHAVEWPQAASASIRPRNMSWEGAGM